MEFTLPSLSAYIPSADLTSIDLMTMLKFIGLFALVTVFMGLLGRVIFGTRSDLNHAVSSAMGILFVYILTIVIYCFNPGDIARYLAPLPFVTFSGSVMQVFSFHSGFSAVCSQVLSMVVLAFLVNLLDTIIPKGKKISSWYLLRLLSVILALVLHTAASWAIHTYLPEMLVQYAPVILVLILLAMLLLGAAKFLLGAVLTVTNPLLGALYTFFFANIIGKQLSKSVLTTLLLCAVVYLMEHFGYVSVLIATAALAAYIPLILVLLVLWYLIGHVL